MTIKDELVALQRNGILKPERAVKWAHDHPRSDLHAALEWNDGVAANEHRIWQVRHLIAVHIINEKGARQMLSLSIDRAAAGGGYRDIDAILGSPPLREVLLADALADLERVRLKYRGLVELAKVWDELRRVRSRARSRKTKQAKHTGAKLRHARTSPAMQA